MKICVEIKQTLMALLFVIASDSGVLKCFLQLNKVDIPIKLKLIFLCVMGLMHEEK